MGAAPKPEFPPLLPFGFHRMTEAELFALVVSGFPLSKRRSVLWTNLLWLVAELQKHKLKCALWLDGSYLTQKIEPDDIDIVIDISISQLQNCTPNQGKLLVDLGKMVYRSDPMKLHTFVIWNAPAGHLAMPRGEALKRLWINNFGYSLVGRVPKGIALFEVVP
jgi:hypothetical protein